MRSVWVPGEVAPGTRGVPLCGPVSLPGRQEVQGTALSLSALHHHHRPDSRPHPASALGPVSHPLRCLVALRLVCSAPSPRGTRPWQQTGKGGLDGAAHVRAPGPGVQCAGLPEQDTRDRGDGVRCEAITASDFVVLII